MTIASVWISQWEVDDDADPSEAEGWREHWYEEEPIRVTAKRVYVSGARRRRPEA